MVTEWFWEGHVVQSLVKHLQQEGWMIESVADTAKKEKGVDIRATREERALLIEVKGFPSSFYQDPARRDKEKKTKPTIQAPVWYAQALLKAMMLQSEFPGADIAIGLPEHRRYQRLIDKTSQPLQKLGLTIYLVSEEGEVRT